MELRLGRRSVSLLGLVYMLAIGCSAEGNTRRATEQDSDIPANTDKSSNTDETETTQGDNTDDSDTVPDFPYDEKNPNLTPGDSNNDNRKDRLTCDYETIEETDTTFKGQITIGNANDDYVWNGETFSIYSVSFTTTSTITSAQTSDWISVTYSKTDDKTIAFDFGWMSIFELGDLVTFEVEGTKNGQYPYPTRCIPNYIRGEVIYPEYQKLPYTYWAGKDNVSSTDLIHDKNNYYTEIVQPITEAIFVYEPPHNTQIHIGIPPSPMYDYFDKNPDGDELLISNYDDIQLFIPNKLVAMGIGFAYEWFKFNPNFFVALSTKENFGFGLIPKQTWDGGYSVTLDGKEYSWYYVLSPDGPFQQETGNFIDMASFFPDYFPPGSVHDDYTNIQDPTDDHDPKWATSILSSALSSVVTRETLWAYFEDDYDRLVFDAADKWLELSIITYVYNRGIYSLCPTGIFDDFDYTLSLDNAGDAFGLIGVADHVPTINAIVWNMNEAVDNLYDAELTMNDVEAFFTAIRFVYQRAMTDAQWAAMIDDIGVAFDVLAKHWGGNTVSYRYDFLTLLRVARIHMPNPTNARPTSQSWKDRVTGFTCN